MNGHHRPVLVGIALCGVVVACSANTRDYAEQAERFLTSDDSVEGRYGTAFTNPECAEPQSTRIGATFVCTATAADDTDWTFVVTIEADGRYTVSAADR